MAYRQYHEEKRSEQIDAILDAMDQLGPLLRQCRYDDQLMDSVRATCIAFSGKDKPNQVLDAEVRRIDAVRSAMNALFEQLQKFDSSLRLDQYEIIDKVTAESQSR